MSWCWDFEQIWSQTHKVSTWTSRRPRARQRNSLIGGSMWGGLRSSLSLYLSHDRLRGDWGLWFPHRTSFICSWSSLVQTVPARGCSHLLRLMLGLRLQLFRHASIRHRAAFHGGRAVLVGDWLCGVRLSGAHRFSVSGSQFWEAIRLLVAALGPPFDRGRLLEGEIWAVGVWLGTAGPSL